MFLCEIFLSSTCLTLIGLWCNIRWCWFTYFAVLGLTSWILKEMLNMLNPSSSTTPSNCTIRVFQNVKVSVRVQRIEEGGCILSTSLPPPSPLASSPSSSWPSSSPVPEKEGEACLLSPQIGLVRNPFHGQFVPAFSHPEQWQRWFGWYIESKMAISIIGVKYTFSASSAS